MQVASTANAIPCDGWIYSCHLVSRAFGLKTLNEHFVSTKSSQVPRGTLLPTERGTPTHVTLHDAARTNMKRGMPYDDSSCSPHGNDTDDREKLNAMLSTSTFCCQHTRRCLESPSVQQQLSYNALSPIQQSLGNGYEVAHNSILLLGTSVRMPYIDKRNRRARRSRHVGNCIPTLSWISAFRYIATRLEKT